MNLPAEPASRVAMSADGGLLAFQVAGYSVQLVDATTGQSLHVLEGHDGEVHALAFGPGPNQLSGVSEDGTIRTWNTASGRPGADPHGRGRGALLHRDSPLGPGAPDRCGERRRPSMEARRRLVRAHAPRRGRLRRRLRPRSVPGRLGFPRQACARGGPGIGESDRPQRPRPAGAKRRLLRGRPPPSSRGAMTPSCASGTCSMGRRWLSSRDPRTTSRPWPPLPGEGASPSGRTSEARSRSTSSGRPACGPSRAPRTR